MEKVYQNRIILFTALVFVAIAAFSLFAYKQTLAAPASLGETCAQAPVHGGEMPWEVLSRHLVNAVFFR